MRQSKGTKRFTRILYSFSFVTGFYPTGFFLGKVLTRHILCKWSSKRECYELIARLLYELFEISDCQSSSYFTEHKAFVAFLLYNALAIIGFIIKFTCSFRI
jgi:hypothetical protein